MFAKVPVTRSRFRFLHYDRMFKARLFHEIISQYNFFELVKTDSSSDMIKFQYLQFKEESS